MIRFLNLITTIACVALCFPCQAAEKEKDKEDGKLGLAARNLRKDGIYLLTSHKRRTPSGVARTSAVAGGVILLVFLDDEIREEARQSRNDSVDRWEDRIEPLGHARTTSLAALSIYTVGKATGNERTAETGRCLIESLFFTETIKSVAKGLTGRNPPGDGARANEFFEGGGIFPSGHTARAFAFATVLSERYGDRVGWVAYPLATLVGLSRIVNDSHWASDVFAGAALGYAIGKAITNRRAARWREKHQVSVSPVFSRGDRRAGLVLRYTF
jgi:hypothetical protein